MMTAYSQRAKELTDHLKNTVLIAKKEKNIQANPQNQGQENGTHSLGLIDEILVHNLVVTSLG